jgi:hypothetical protein
VAIPKIKAPYLDVLVRRAGDDELGIGRDIHCEDG